MFGTDNTDKNDKTPSGANSRDAVNRVMQVLDRASKQPQDERNATSISDGKGGRIELDDKSVSSSGGGETFFPANLKF